MSAPRFLTPPGHYVFPDLPVGPYRLDVKAHGFKDYIQNGIVLVVNNNPVNVAMQVGAVSERSKSTATAGMVETKEKSVSSVIDQQRINDLPLNNRQATQLILTLGAALYADSGDTGSKTFWSSTRIAVAGGQGNGTAYLLDGGDNTDAMSNVNMPFPFPDALQEFSIETSAVSSRFGTHPGATVNAVTKSGSNRFHGDLFEFIRNGDMDARNFFAPMHDTLKRNQYGGTVGGKIIKDKLFFFGGFQGTRNRQNPPQSTDAYSHRGDAERRLQHDGGPRATRKALTLTNPLRRHLPEQPDSAHATEPGRGGAGDEVFAGGSAATVRQCDLRHSANRRFERSSSGASTGCRTPSTPFLDGISPTTGSNPPVFIGNNLLTTTSPGNFELAQSATIGDTYTFTPNPLNSFHFSFNRIRDNRGPTDLPISWTSWAPRCIARCRISC